eukprot:Clim_evm237s157 gene=Clim_evmTU237s157
MNDVIDQTLAQFANLEIFENMRPWKSEEEFRKVHPVRQLDDVNPELFALPSWTTALYIALVAYGLWVTSPGSPQSQGPVRRVSQTFMKSYNGVQVIYNLITVIVTLLAVYHGVVFAGNDLGIWVSNPWIQPAISLHYFSKYLDCVDTYIIVQNRKRDQLSFLHYYHHVSIIWCWFMVLYYRPDPDAYLGCLLNSFVHTIMYGYYLCSCYGIKVPLVIKKNITNLQMVQFLTVTSQSVFVILYREDSRAPMAWLQLWEMMSLFVLFGLWRMTRYAAPAKATKAAKAA